LLPFIRDGRVKALAVTSERRSPALPDVPSMAESGFAGFDVLNYFGLMAPRGTPPAVLDRLQAAVAKVVQLPDVKARFVQDGLEAAAPGRDAWAAFIQRDYNAWKQVVQAQNLIIAPD
jgi:tripartite-type tricarboxylate transporter receptor subunit TctC